MAKSATNEEIIEQQKAKQKQADDDAARIKAEQEEMGGKDVPLSPEAQAAADKIAAAERDEGDIPISEDDPAPRKSVLHSVADGEELRETTELAYKRGRAAADKIKLIAMSYPRTTPNEHTIFGFGGHRFTLGDLRDLTNIR